MTPATQFRLEDAASRDRIRNSLDESLIVEASAGTGKTSELVRRIVRVLEAGRAKVGGIIAVTFTHKAAGELKLRLRQGLDRRRAGARDPAEIRNLEDALEHLEEAAIGTIHSFCAQLLRQRPVEAGTDPAFEELSESESARLYQRAFRHWMQEKLNASSPGLRRTFARLAWREGWNAGSPIEELQETGRKLIEWRDFPEPWRREPFEREREIDALASAAIELADFSARCTRPSDNLYQALRPARDLATWIERAEGARPRDYDALESLLVKLAGDLNENRRKGRGPYADGVLREHLLARRDALVQALAAFRTRADADLAVLLRDELWELVERYDRLKRIAGKLDFVDLLVLARNLIRDNAEVRRYFQQRFTHVFVDEFQDTDPVQAEILLLLAADDPDETDWLQATPAAGKLFVVGDPKQSIYKFRRADVILYQKVRDELVARGVGLVPLAKSFRAVRPIQECVNAAFAPVMTGDGEAGQSDYVPLEEHARAIDGQPCLIALPAPKPYGSRGVTKKAINECLPDAIVAFAEWLVRDSGWKVRDPLAPSELAPLQARHIAILFRRFTNWGQDLTRDYVRSLEARGIRHLLVGSKSYHKREEVETVRAALAAVEWPDDELSVFATLKGSLFAISDAALLRFRHELGRLHPFRRLPDNLNDELKPIAEVLALLAELHRARNRRPVTETVNLLLEAARAHAGFAFRPAGHQVLANVYRVADLARSFEMGGGISFRGFVEELEAQAEKAESAEAPVLEEGADGVRLMTVHTAKGLEFPVVILADMTAKLAAAQPDRYLDGERRLCALRLLRWAPWELLEHEPLERAREEAEGVRVAYVGATRARDLLVVPAVGDSELDGCWVSPLNRAIYPGEGSRRRSGPGPGCPVFGDDSVLDRPPELTREHAYAVRPGLHAPREGAHYVVWWDPKLLRLNPGANFGLRQQDLLAGDDLASLEAYQQWKARREAALERGRRPACELLLATEAAALPPGFSCEVQTVTLDRPVDRPSGPRFGTLVHQALRDVDLAADESAVAALVRMHARLLGATDEEARAAVHAVRSALAHSLLARARSASRCHREFPVLLKLEDSRLLEGVIDLAYLDNGAWTVVDFKTDADLPLRAAMYRRQVEWYALALSRITDAPVRAWLLNV